MLLSPNSFRGQGAFRHPTVVHRRWREHVRGGAGYASLEDDDPGAPSSCSLVSNRHNAGSPTKPNDHGHKRADHVWHDDNRRSR